MAHTIITPEFSQAISETKEMLARKRQSHVLFIEGGAGTGKSTLINLLKNQVKGTVVAAPTGVAATITGGTTLHRLFNFPLKPLEPHKDRENSYPSPVLRKMSMLVIDEAGMVRSDIIDGVDYYLRRATRRTTPFGGVPVVIVGDLHQIPPVVKHDEQEILKNLGYRTPQFFGAKVWEEFGLKTVKLTHVFRQENREFAGILNRLREGNLTEEDLNRLNTRVGVAVPANTVTLTPTRRRAEEINRSQLEKLPTPDVSHKARVKGDFRADDTLAEENLVLRRGALVMMLNNDKEGRWANGTTGIYRGDSKGVMHIELSNGDEVDVLRHTWERFRYKWDGAKNEITRVKLGEMEQFPVKVAYAGTIHKGQGQTLERCNVDFGNGMFATGQAYVALSRVTSLEGLFLSRPLQRQDCMVDAAVQEFYANGCQPVLRDQQETQPRERQLAIFA